MRTKQEYINLIQSSTGFSVKELVLTEGTDITDLDYETLRLLLHFRRWSGISTMVTSAYRPGDDGAHGLGKAFDLVLFKEWLRETIHYEHLWRLATTFPWWGVGIYFDWEFVNKEGERVPCVGIHVDNHTGSNRPLRWIRITKEIDGKPVRLYYYQDVESGLFYNSNLKETMGLNDALKYLRTN